VIYHENDWVN